MKLDIAFGEYDRTRVLANGTVKIDGVDVCFHSYRIVSEVFAGMIRDRAYDVSELGMTYFLRTMDLEDAPFIAIPVFPVRCFRHSAIYVNKATASKRRRISSAKPSASLRSMVTTPACGQREFWRKNMA